MTSAIDALKVGVLTSIGSHMGSKYVAPAIDEVMVDTSRKVKEVAKDHGNKGVGAVTCASVGFVVAGPPGAVVGGVLGYQSGGEQDDRAGKKYRETGEDERCVVM